MTRKADDSLGALLEAARRAGADAAEAIEIRGDSVSVSCRLGALESVERSETREVGLRIFIGKRQAGVSACGPAADDVATLAARAVAMARAAPEDPFCGLPEDNLYTDTGTDADGLDIADATEPTTDVLETRARAAEDAARASTGITNSEGAESSFQRTRACRAATNGFSGQSTGTMHAVSCAVLAGDEAMERDYAFALARHAEDLTPPDAIGREAATRTLRRLNPAKPKSRALPVIFDARVAASLLRAFAAAISGSAVARGASFLKDKEGERIFPANLTIEDNPLRPRGLRSRAFDSEGIATTPRRFVEGGVLSDFLLDTPSARQLNRASTGHAAAAPGQPPSPAPTNLALLPGAQTPDALIKSIKEGLFITETIGHGINLITGDYSQGAAGLRIQNGALAEPVSEITIAGHLGDMFAHLTPADDLLHRTGVDAPTLLVERMTLAGA